MLDLRRLSWIVGSRLGLALCLSACGGADPTEPTRALEAALLDSPLRAAGDARWRRCAPLTMQALGSYRTGLFDEAAAEPSWTRVSACSGP